MWRVDSLGAAPAAAGGWHWRKSPDGIERLSMDCQVLRWLAWRCFGFPRVHLAMFISGRSPANLLIIARPSGVCRRISRGMRWCLRTESQNGTIWFQLITFVFVVIAGLCNTLTRHTVLLLNILFMLLCDIPILRCPCFLLAISTFAKNWDKRISYYRSFVCWINWRRQSFRRSLLTVARFCYLLC